MKPPWHHSPMIERIDFSGDNIDWWKLCEELHWILRLGPSNPPAMKPEVLIYTDDYDDDETEYVGTFTFLRAQTVWRLTLESPGVWRRAHQVMRWIKSRETAEGADDE